MRTILERQGYHLAGYAALGWLLLQATAWIEAGQGTAWGFTTREWVVTSWLLAAVHQGWVALCWRLELHRGTLSRWLGRAGFPVYEAGYLLSGLARLLCVIPISVSSPHTLPLPPWSAIALIVITTPPILWVAYSFVVYFGLHRTAGADHFYPEYRAKPIESRGAFGTFRNPGYAVGLLALYHPGLLMRSGPGLVAAAAHHAFVWLHYWCTELPDLRTMYGEMVG